MAIEDDLEPTGDGTSGDEASRPVSCLDVCSIYVYYRQSTPHNICTEGPLAGFKVSGSLSGSLKPILEVNGVNVTT